MMDIEPVENTASERASERGSERTQLHGANTNSSKNSSNNTEPQLLGANTKSSENRNNKTETPHTTHKFHVMPSVAISVHCCLHWCSHRHLASVFAPCSHPAILHRCSHLACFHCSSLGSLQHHGDDRCGRAKSLHPESIVDSIASRNQISLAFIRGHETDLGCVPG